MSTLTGHVVKLWTHVFPCAVAPCVHVVPPRVAGSSLWTRPEGALGSVGVALVVLLPVLYTRWKCPQLIGQDAAPPDEEFLSGSPAPVTFDVPKPDCTSQP